MKLPARFAILLLALSTTARADAVIPNAHATTPGPSGQYAVLGNGSTIERTFQIGYAASELSGIGVGSVITSIGFRLPSNASTVAGGLTYTDYQIEIGQAANAIGSFSAVFAENQGADTIVARSGALRIAPGSIIGGSTLNPFYSINFTTPYTYQGGPLAITLRWAGWSSNNVAVDAVQVASAPTVVDTVLGTTFSATTGENLRTLNAPIVRLGVEAAAVPEPSSIALAGIGLAAAAALGWMRRRAA